MDSFIWRGDIKFPKFSTDVRDKSFRRWSVKLCSEATFLGVDGTRLLFSVPNIAHAKAEETQVHKFVTLREYGQMDMTGLEFVAAIRSGSYGGRCLHENGPDYFLFRDTR